MGFKDRFLNVMKTVGLAEDIDPAKAKASSSNVKPDINKIFQDAEAQTQVQRPVLAQMAGTAQSLQRQPVPQALAAQYTIPSPPAMPQGPPPSPPQIVYALPIHVPSMRDPGLAASAASGNGGAAVVQQPVLAPASPPVTTASPHISQSVLNLPTSPSIMAAPIELGSIYQQLGVPSSPFPVERIISMITRLSGRPLDAVRDAVRDALMLSIGATDDLGSAIENVLKDARAKSAAISAYGNELSTGSSELVRAKQSEISLLQKQIDDKQKEIDAERTRYGTMLQSCQTESARLNLVIQLLTTSPGQNSFGGNVP